MGKNRCNHCAPNRASGARLSLGEPPRVDRAELQTAAGNSPGRRLHLTLPAAAGPDRSPYGAGLYGIMGIRSSGTGSHRPGNGHEGLRPLPNLQNTGAQQKLCACTAFPSLPLGVLCVEHRLGACGATSFLRNSDKIYEKKEMLLRRKSKLKHPQLSIWIAGDFFAQIHL